MEIISGNIIYRPSRSLLTNSLSSLNTRLCPGHWQFVSKWKIKRLCLYDTFIFQIYDESKYLTTAVSTFLQVHWNNPSVSDHSSSSAVESWNKVLWQLGMWHRPASMPWVPKHTASDAPPFRSLSPLNKDWVRLWMQHRHKWSPETHGRERTFCDFSWMDQKCWIPYKSHGQT